MGCTSSKADAEGTISRPLPGGAQQAPQLRTGSTAPAARAAGKAHRRGGRSRAAAPAEAVLSPRQVLELCHQVLQEPLRAQGGDTAAAAATAASVAAQDTGGWAHWRDAHSKQQRAAKTADAALPQDVPPARRRAARTRSAGPAAAAAAAAATTHPEAAAATLPPEPAAEWRPPAAMLAAVALCESAGRPALAQHRESVDDDSLGLCQVLLSTAHWLAGSEGFTRHGREPTRQELLRPEVSAYYCAAYLATLRAHGGRARDEEWVVRSLKGGPKGGGCAEATAFWLRYTKARMLLDQLDTALSARAAAAADAADAPPACTMHVVAPGETLTRIAAAAEVSEAEVLAANPELGPGATPQPHDCIALPVAALLPRLYAVQPGDTAFSIAKAHGVAVGRLLSRNPELSDPANLQPGWLLAVPGLKGDSLPSHEWAELLAQTERTQPLPLPTAAAAAAAATAASQHHQQHAWRGAASTAASHSAPLPAALLASPPGVGVVGARLACEGGAPFARAHHRLPLGASPPRHGVYTRERACALPPLPHHQHSLWQSLAWSVEDLEDPHPGDGLTPPSSPPWLHAVYWGGGEGPAPGSPASRTGHGHELAGPSGLAGAAL